MQYLSLKKAQASQRGLTSQTREEYLKSHLFPLNFKEPLQVVNRLPEQ